MTDKNLAYVYNKLWNTIGFFLFDFVSLIGNTYTFYFAAEQDYKYALALAQDANKHVAYVGEGTSYVDFDLEGTKVRFSQNYVRFPSDASESNDDEGGYSSIDDQDWEFGGYGGDLD